MKKSENIALILQGPLKEDITVKNVHIKILFDNSTLYDEDHLQDNQYHDLYNYTVSWFVPSFAPSGSYRVNLKAYGENETLLMCAEGLFEA